MSHTYSDESYIVVLWTERDGEMEWQREDWCEKGVVDVCILPSLSLPSCLPPSFSLLSACPWQIPSTPSLTRVFHFDALQLLLDTTPPHTRTHMHTYIHIRTRARTRTHPHAHARTRTRTHDLCRSALPPRTLRCRRFTHCRRWQREYLKVAGATCDQVGEGVE